MVCYFTLFFLTKTRQYCILVVIYAAFLRALPTIQTIQYYQLLFVPTLLIMHLTELKNTPVSDLVKLGDFVFAGKPFCKEGVISSNYNLKLNKYE